MCKLVLDRGSVAEFTSVSNIFMDEYMPRANGEFIKIYLHLLRLVNSNNDIADELTTERIADKFNMLESDVIRALNYWAEQNLITLSYNSQNEISGITLESILRNRYIVKGITSTETNLLASVSLFLFRKAQDILFLPSANIHQERFLILQIMILLMTFSFWHRLILEDHLALMTLTVFCI